MKLTSYTFIIATLLFSACSGNQDITTDDIKNSATAENPQGQDDYPEIVFEKDYHDFGVIEEGPKYSYTFTFINKGKSNLIIKDAKASCGCTVPKYTKEPVKPGEQGTIKIEFDSKDRLGMQQKEITLLTNCKNPQQTISFRAEVKASK